MEPTFECVETQCKAMGSENCVFELRKRSEFDLKDKEVIRQIGRKGEKLDLGFLKQP